jgi:two-component system OmpR family response regulator
MTAPRRGALPGQDDRATPLRFERWTFDPAARVLVDAAGVTVPLSTGEYLMLEALIRRPGVVLSRDQLLDLTRGREAAVFDRSVDNQISRLRAKLERDPKTPTIIKTHWGGGYSFAAKVETAGDAAP